MSKEPPVWIASPVPHPETWIYWRNGSKIMGASAKGGEATVLDIRGWGYLTGKGHGALGLDQAAAAEAQDALAEFVIRSCRRALVAPATGRAAIAKLIYEALRFAVWAGGEGICPVDGQDAAEPEKFLFAYSTETGDEDWGTLATRVFAAIDSSTEIEQAFRTGFNRGALYICEHLNEEQIALLRQAEWNRFVVAHPPADIRVPTMGQMQAMTDGLLNDPDAMDRYMSENPLPAEEPERAEGDAAPKPPVFRRCSCGIMQGQCTCP